MRKLMSVLVLLCLVGSVASCYRHSFGEASASGPSSHAKWSHHILWGFLSVNGHTDAGVCGGPPPVRMATYVGPVGLLLGIVTAGIYVPTTTQIWCGQPGIGERGEGESEGGPEAEGSTPTARR